MIQLRAFEGKTVQVQLKAGHNWGVCVATSIGPQPFTMQTKTADGQVAEAPVGMPFLVGEVIKVAEDGSIYGVKMDDQASKARTPGGSGKKLVVVIQDDDIENVTYVASEMLVTLSP
jgi:hypothetical protein